MRPPIWVFLTLISHWRRSPIQLFTVLFGLAIATALWSGVQALNQQARLSYDRAVLSIDGQQSPFLATADGTRFPQSHFIALRLAGWNVAPLLEGRIEINNQNLRIIGLDPVSLMQISDQQRIVMTNKSILPFLLSPGSTHISKTTLDQFGWSKGDRPVTESTKKLPPLVVQSDLAPGLLIVDIGVAQDILSAPNQLSRLLVGEKSTVEKIPLFEVTGNTLTLFQPEKEGDLARLTDSFHLNLTAFGFLAFFVGLFIVHSAIGLAFEQRLSMIRTLRSCGVSLSLLIAVMLIELVLIALFAGAIGVLFGYYIAATLLPDVAASLRGLYGARIGGELTLEPTWWIAGLSMSLVGAVIAAGGGFWKVRRLPLLVTALPEAWHQAEEKRLRLQLIIATILFALFFVSLIIGDHLITGFLMMGCLLLGAALIQPVLLSMLLRFCKRRAKNPLAIWFWSDSQQQLPGLSFALMALLLALGVNIGVGAMVESFRNTFTDWLDRRLASEVYFNAFGDDQALDIIAWLQQQPYVDAILPIRRIETKFREWPTQIYGFQDHDTYRNNWPLIEKIPGVWNAVEAGKAALISEQMALRFDLKPGETIALSTTSGDWSLAIGGIFSDYGNPKSLVMVNINPFLTHWPNVSKTRHGVRVVKHAIPKILDGIASRFNLPPTRLFDQATLKRESSKIFERTFAITVALNTLTLGVAGAAMLTSLLTLSASRLPLLAPLWALGITQRQLAWIELLKSLMLAIFTALLSLPLGLLLTWCLVAVINVQAFGWRLPFQLFPGQWGQLFIMTIVVALLASLLPVIRLRNMPPAQLLKVFSDEK